MTDIQAGIGAAQMDKLSGFCRQRKEHFDRWSALFSKYNEYFILPQATDKSDPAWFSFIVSLKEGAPFTRDELTRYLNDNLIETRNLFAGNITRQPAFADKKWRLAEQSRGRIPRRLRCEAFRRSSEPLPGAATHPASIQQYGRSSSRIFASGGTSSSSN